MMNRSVWTAAFSLTVLTFLTISSLAPAQLAPRSPIRRIDLSFKRDPRVVDPFRGIGVWADGDSYTGAYGQDTVEVRAAGVDASGRSLKINPSWMASDNGMVTISPSQGDDVKVTVHKEGESRLNIVYQGLSKELVVSATKTGTYVSFSISPVSLAKNRGSVAGEMDPALKDRRAQLSYAAGMRLAETLRAQSQSVDPDLVAKAMKDVLGGGATLMNDEQQRMALMAVETELNVTAASIERKKTAERNKEESEDFLEDNKKKDGIVTLPSGLQYKVLKAGDGKKPTGLDVAVCQYRGSLIDGTVFDDSHKHKDGGPVSFPVRAVIKGWQEALKMMPAGSRWEIFVPPDLAYGEHGVPQSKIPPNAALVFDVELLSVRGPGNPAAADPETQKAKLTPEQMEAIKKMVEGRDKESETKSEKNQ